MHSEEETEKHDQDQILIFRSEILGTIGDGLIFSPNFFLGNGKHGIFGMKI